jgi:hypothetical protein
MEINLPVEELRKCKLFIATPMYGGQCAGMYTRSIADLTGLMAQYQVRMQLYYLFNESLITRARNYCVDEFLRSECTHLMFIDSDIGFNAKDVIALLALSHRMKIMMYCVVHILRRQLLGRKSKRLWIVVMLMKILIC